MVDDEFVYERSIADRLIRFNSYFFWSQIFAEHPKSPHAVFWNNADSNGYREHTGMNAGKACPYCEDWHILEPNREIGGYPILKVYCLCDTLQMLVNVGTKAYESFYDYRARLSQILPIDVPQGAAADTRIIIKNCAGWLQKPTKWMLLAGGTGTAKSHILFALRRRLGGFGYYVTSSDLVQQLQAAVTEGGTSEILYELIHAPFLLIDDFGMDHQGQGKYGINMIAHILDQRYLLKNRAPVVMATNLSLDDFPSSKIDNMVRIGSRMMDSELSIINVFTQADYRLRDTKNAAGLK